MADSKYKDLPGIAYDQADVYETDDLPESDQVQEESEEESESIERLHVNASDAFNKFKGKYISSKGVDFSDRISRKSRTGYNVIYGEWELAEEGVKETPMQKLRRLQCETKELYDEITEMKEKSADLSQEELKNLTEIIPQVQIVSKQLNDMKLSECIGSEKVDNLSDINSSHMKTLERHIETFKQSSSVTETALKDTIKKEESKGDSNLLQYQMVYLPEKNRAVTSQNIVTMEQRLANLEKIIGTTNNDKLTKFVQTLKSEGIFDAAQQLGTKASLLDSNQLDATESRISALLHRMDNLAQKKSSLPQDTDMEQKISEMYEVLKHIESNQHVLPQVVERMAILQTVHHQAARFNSSLTHLEEMYSTLTSDLETSKVLLRTVKDNFVSNLEPIQSNIEHLDERIKKLEK